MVEMCCSNLALKAVLSGDTGNKYWDILAGYFSLGYFYWMKSGGNWVGDRHFVSISDKMKWDVYKNKSIQCIDFFLISFYLVGRIHIHLIANICCSIRCRGGGIIYMFFCNFETIVV